ncbi:TIGR03086 family metal-binding protein [Actinomycetospora sp. CA-084318]|uniref:TIGR03086 family metal-binding protein n=1 Tax=Actinomycetospora sp. CA-084318 TaxID=3239892 RepID=UPI003D958EFB
MIDLAPACTVTGTLIASLDESELGLATPCPEYDVRGLLGHLDVVAPGGLDRLAAIWRDPAAWVGHGELGLPNATWGRIALTEVVVHGWDLAQATGRPIAFDEETLRATLEHVLEFVPRAPVPQLWGTPVVLPSDAPLLDRIVAATGRAATVEAWRSC